jgi:predicted amidohydrolase
MILDPYGEILTEIKSFEDEITVGTITRDKLELAGGFRYRNARRPELYRDIIGREHRSETIPVWLNEK